MSTKELRRAHPLTIFSAPYKYEKPTNDYVARCPRCHTIVASISSSDAAQMKQVGVTSHRDSTENHMCLEDLL